MTTPPLQEKKPVIIFANDDDAWHRTHAWAFREAYPMAEMIFVENIADIFTQIKKCGQEGKTVCAIICDERFELNRNLGHMLGDYVRASPEIPNIRAALEENFTSKGKTIPIIITSGGTIRARCQPNIYFLDINSYDAPFDILEDKDTTTNPLARILNVALGLSQEDLSSLQQTTNDTYWVR